MSSEKVEEKAGFHDATNEPDVAKGEVQERGIHVSEKGADAAAILAAKGFGIAIDPAESERVRKKIDRHLLPLMMYLYCLQFMDKTTLGSSAILGIKTDCHLTTTQYNLLGSLFYIGYLAFEWPQNLALQRFPVGKWMACNITLWGVFLCCFAACQNFAGLAVLRVGLGMCEGAVTAGFMIITSMFYTHAEQARRVGYWFLMNGTAQIASGLLSFAVLQVGLDHPFKPWRAFFLLTGGLTFTCAILYFLYFPDSPANAKFLTEQEKIVAIERIKENRTGVENKVWKKEQFIEALCDWKLWAFAIYAAFGNIPNSLTNQNSLIIKSLGFETWQTTLLGCVGGVVEILTIWSSAFVLKWKPNQRGYIAAVYLLPNILGSILVITLPYSDKAGILVSLYVTGVGTPGFVIALAWINSAVAGHTKKTTTNAAFLIGYCLGNLLAPQMWLDKYQPRNYVPWAVITVSYSICVMIILCIRWALSRENKRRDLLQAESSSDEDEYGFIDEVMEDGTTVTHKIEKAFLDLTDKQNLSFRYPL